jgi:alkanesulfonate monooxygenase SsuD/methylene tetrahydromethanopterin reductase-like flavin-dependent oxidoreductase (luciferase family)
MVGSIGERMLAIALPHVDAWNGWYDWFDNTTDGLRPMLARVDEACRSVGRDPTAVERTVALHVRLPGWVGRTVNEQTAGAFRPIEGTPEQVADALRSFAAIGVATHSSSRSITGIDQALDPSSRRSTGRG